MQKQSTIHFFGGAGSVTGSNFLLDTGGMKLLVDCGLTQGSAVEQKKNSAEFEYDPKEVSHLIVTHAHLDHVGRIPLLVKRGFNGKILSTKATRVIAEAIIEDELAIMEHNARHHKGEILYTKEDIAHSMHKWETIDYHQQISLPDTVELQLLNSGHILGSAMAKFSRDSSSIVFTGDLGSGNSPLLPACENPVGINYLVMESVYGDRIRNDANRREQLENIIEDSIARGGTLLIPAFSTERTQDLLFEIRALMLEKRVPAVPVYVDSPLAERITQSYLANPEFFAPAIAKRVEGGENIFSFPEVHFVKDSEASHALTLQPGPKIVLAGSGMGQGGRVMSHEKVLLPDPHNTVLIVGYQAAGTTGRKLIEGMKEIEVWGEKVAVRAKIEAIYGYSAHMDGEQLVQFVNQAQKNIKQVFVVMGEPAASSTLVQRIRDYLGIKAIAPEAGESVQIEL
jgi:metallo-beta-lactamase family protein